MYNFRAQLGHHKATLMLWGSLQVSKKMTCLCRNFILFCKYLSPLDLHRNGSIFMLYIWISVFRRKNCLEIYFSVAEICKKQSNKEIIHFLWDTLYLDPSLSCAELGTAQPQLVSNFSETRSKARGWESPNLQFFSKFKRVQIILAPLLKLFLKYPTPVYPW